MPARSLNRATILGNLVRDAEQKHTPNGKSVTKLSIATNRRYKDKSNEWKDEVEYHNVTAWDAEALTPYLTKGKQVYVEGRIQTRSWDKDGEKRYSTEIVSDNIILLGGEKSKAAPSSDGFEDAPF